MVTRSLGTVALVVLAAAAAPPTAAQEPVAPPAAGSLVETTLTLRTGEA